MKAPDFDLCRPDSVDEVVVLLHEHRENVKVLAGGQSLVPLLNFRLARPDVIVDINRVAELDRLSADDGAIVIGAGVRQAEFLRAHVSGRTADLLRQALSYVAHPVIRNRGTVVGSLAHGDPAAELPAVAVATDAVFVARSVRGRREIAAADFYRGFLETALDQDELLVEVQFPWISEDAIVRFQEVSRRAGDFAMVGVATALNVAPDGTFGSTRFAFSGVSDVPLRGVWIEEAVRGRKWSPHLEREVASVIELHLTPPDDLHASAGYRLAMAQRMAIGALAEAAGRGLRTDEAMGR